MKMCFGLAKKKKKQVKQPIEEEEEECPVSKRSDHKACYDPTAPAGKITDKTSVSSSSVSF